jgi:hypothetical protein
MCECTRARDHLLACVCLCMCLHSLVCLCQYESDRKFYSVSFGSNNKMVLL